MVSLDVQQTFTYVFVTNRYIKIITHVTMWCRASRSFILAKMQLGQFKHFQLLFRPENGTSLNDLSANTCTDLL